MTLDVPDNFLYDEGIHILLFLNIVQAELIILDVSTNNMYGSFFPVCLKDVVKTTSYSLS